MLGRLRWLLVAAIVVAPVTVDLRPGFTWSEASAQGVWPVNCDPVVLNYYYFNQFVGRRSGSALRHHPVPRPRVPFGELASPRSGSTLVCCSKANSTPKVVFCGSAPPGLRRGSVDSGVPVQRPICPKAHATYWAARTAVMANTMENARSLRMDMSSVIARQPHECIPARKMNGREC
jgi:hypothetical protein